MPWTKAGSVVVLVAHQFNPSIITQTWLVRNGLLNEEEMQPGYVFTDMFVQVRSNRFNLLVLPDQLQFVPTVAEDDEQNVISEKVGIIVRILPHTPYRAIGLNFSWHLIPRDANVARLSQELFFNPEKPLYRLFNASNAHFGAYLSKDVLDFRLKLDVKPILIAQGEGKENRLQFLFNFHADLTDNPADQIQRYLVRWNDVKRESEAIVDAIESRDNQ